MPDPRASQPRVKLPNGGEYDSSRFDTGPDTANGVRSAVGRAFKVTREELAKREKAWKIRKGRRLAVR